MKMKKKLLLTILLIASVFCFAEKWHKIPLTNNWGEVIGYEWKIDPQVVVENSRGFRAATIGFISTSQYPSMIVFELYFNSFAPDINRAYIDVKDNPREQNVIAYIARDKDMIQLQVDGMTLARYRQSYEGRMVSFRWAGGEYVTIKAPVWED